MNLKCFGIITGAVTAVDTVVHCLQDIEGKILCSQGDFMFNDTRLHSVCRQLKTN